MDIKSRRLIGGHMAVMADTAIAYRAKWHQKVSTSLTEVEFIQTTSAAKMAKYTQVILKELKIKQHGPTIMYKDNATAIMMVNASKPNRRTRYINISYFTIQEWAEKGNMKLAHICGVANPSDALTKTLGWTLNQHYVARMMEHNGYKHAHTPPEKINCCLFFCLYMILNFQEYTFNIVREDASMNIYLCRIASTVISRIKVMWP